MNKTQIIDVTRSAVITDPEAFYENLMSTGQEDSPERTIPIVAYEGYNFLPTLYGYRSYFDTTATLDIAALGSRCDSMVLYQFANYSNVLVALCEDGIWTNSGGTASEVWTHKVTLSIPAPGSYLAWTYCVIENVLYMYRQGNASVYKLTPTAFGPVTIVSFVPNFLNMTGQMGIFRANGRLGFWDSANSISWSSLFDFTDFTPAIITLAANAIFNDVLGRIVHVQAFGSGFIIYSTKNIVGAQFNTTGSILFSAKSITEQAGIWTSKQVCRGATDMEHFAYTNTGIKRVKSDYTVEDIFVGIYDFLRESRDSVYLSFLQGRYLFLSLIDPAYISGKVSFEVVDLGDLTIRLLHGGEEVTDPEDIPTAIDGIPLEDDLVSKVLSGASSGLYTQWQASGSKMVLIRRSPMSPYVLDDPLTPEDETVYEANSDPLITDADLIIARDEATLSNPISIDNSTPYLLDLGWTTSATTGSIGTALQQFKTRQDREWSETKLLMDNLRYKIQSVLSPNVLTVREPGYTFDSYAAAGSAAGGLSTPPTDTDLIEMPYYQSIGFPVETFTGVGTRTPTWEYKSLLDKGLKIYQRKTSSYAAKLYASGSVGMRDSIGGSHFFNTDYSTSYHITYGWPNPELTPGSSPNTFLVTGSEWGSPLLEVGPDNIPASYDPALLNILYDQEVFPGYIPGPPYGANWDTVKSVAAPYLVYPSTISRVDPGGNAIVCDFHSVREISSTDSSVVYYVYYTIPEVPSRPGLAGHLMIGIYATISLAPVNNEWAVVALETVSLRISITDITPVESTAYATQENLDWGRWLEDSPDPDFPYDTYALEISIPSFSLVEGTVLPEHLDVSFPGATFLLQDATTAPIYPDYTGALVFDTGLQKWGKCKADYRTLVDYSPINSNHDQIISYTNFGLDSGILKSDGSIRLFSSKCTDSFIRYGKLAFSRQGYTYPEEIQIHFRRPFTGIIGVDASLDGRSIHSEFHQEETFAGVGLARIYPTHAGKWYTMSIGGEFDLRSIEFTGRVSGIR